MRAAFFLILCCAAALPAHAQATVPIDTVPLETPPPPVDQTQQTPAPQTLDRTPAVLHGFVRNTVTGEGIPRALVRIEGDAGTGALTDGDGRFEITGIPVGPQAVDVLKPGFFNPAFAGNAEAPAGVSGPPHNVLVAAEMPDVVFMLAPTCTIRGQVDLSSGEPAEGIQVGLVRRIVTDGRAAWQPSGFIKTGSDGSYRFGGLDDGQYKLYTTPAFDSEPIATLVAPGKAAAAERWGYAGVYYPDARDPSGAAVIPLSNGAEIQANFTLTREPFRTISIALLSPQSSAAARTPGGYSATIGDGEGHELAYTTQYNANAHTIQAALPDGAYSVVVTSTQGLQRPLTRDNSAQTVMALRDLVGEADFSVAGRAIANLRVPLTPVTPPLMQISVIHGSAGTGPTGGVAVSVMISPAQSMGGAMMGEYISGTTDGPLESNYMAPGAYWVHTFLHAPGLCESAFTAGGASLAREPLTIGLTGATAPMQLTLRDDCARLALQLPEDLLENGAGEEKYYTVFVVPDFDFTSYVSPIVLRPSSGGSFTVADLTPGSYHVYTFEGEASLEYHNPDALRALPNPGQTVTLSPGATANLVVEAPAQ
jgi:hypothetical protein